MDHPNLVTKILTFLVSYCNDLKTSVDSEKEDVDYNESLIDRFIDEVKRISGHTCNELMRPTTRNYPYTYLRAYYRRGKLRIYLVTDMDNPIFDYADSSRALDLNVLVCPTIHLTAESLCVKTLADWITYCSSPASPMTDPTYGTVLIEDFGTLLAKTYNHPDGEFTLKFNSGTPVNRVTFESNILSLERFEHDQ